MDEYTYYTEIDILTNITKTVAQRTFNDAEVMIIVGKDEHIFAIMSSEDTESKDAFIQKLYNAIDFAEVHTPFIIGEK